MLAGSEGLGGIAFDDYQFAFRAGSAALALILFDGGLNTPLDTVRRALAPAGLLATVGVVGTMFGVAFVAHRLALPWSSSFLLGAIVSSTDAAAVFAVLRSNGIQLKHRVGGTLEVESGINDPVAVILTTLLTRQLLGERRLDPDGHGEPVASRSWLAEAAAWRSVPARAGCWRARGCRRVACTP
jgi:cell volume regulation protein A